MRLDLPPVTKLLLGANIVVFLLQFVANDALVAYFALWPFGPDVRISGTSLVVGFRSWELVTYGFLHGGVMHLLSNMLGLLMFGWMLEARLGSARFALLYFVSVVGAALIQLGVIALTGDYYPTLGASGGVFGLVLGVGVLMPWTPVVGPILFPLPAWVAAIVYAALELTQGVIGTQAGVAHFAHLGGMLGAYVLIQYWRGRLPLRPQRRLL